MAVTRVASGWYKAAKAAGHAERELKYLHDAIIDLRRFYSGFKARDGFSLKPRTLARMPLARYERIRSLAIDLRRELSQPHKVVRPRSRASKSALASHTGQVDSKRKTFIVHTADPDTTTIKIVGTRKKKQVQEVTTVEGGRFTQRHFYFRDYTKRRIKTMVDILAVAERMIKQMPPGQYVFISSLYGEIGTNMDRRLLLAAIERNWLAYDAAPDMRSGRPDNRGLAQTLLGFKLIATTPDGGRRSLEERYTRRERMIQAKQAGLTRVQLRRMRARGR